MFQFWSSEAISIGYHVILTFFCNCVCFYLFYFTYLFLVLPISWWCKILLYVQLPLSFNTCLLSPQISHFSEESGPFYWRMKLEYKIWDVHLLDVTEVVLFLVPLGCHHEDTCMYTKAYMYAHLKHWYTQSSISVVR